MQKKLGQQIVEILMVLLYNRGNRIIDFLKHNHPYLECNIIVIYSI